MNLRCNDCNGELSYCGFPSSDGIPTLDCLVCQLREQLARVTSERDQWRGRCEGMQSGQTQREARAWRQLVALANEFCFPRLVENEGRYQIISGLRAMSDTHSDPIDAIAQAAREAGIEVE